MQHSLPMRHRHRYSLKAFWPPLAAVLLLFYFCYHFVTGNRGMLAFDRLKVEAAAMDAHLAVLEEQRRVREQQVQLLRRDHIDPDMLDEQTRRVLGYGEEGEIVIMLPKTEESEDSVLELR